MDLTDLIVEEVVKAQSSALRILRNKKNAGKKALNKFDFADLIKLLEANPREILTEPSLSKKEQDILSTAILKAKFTDPDDLFICLTRAKTKLTPVFLHSLLTKRYRISAEAEGHLAEYLHGMVAENTLLCHLKVLLVVSRYYPRLVSLPVLRLCAAKDHPICKQILKAHSGAE